MNIKKEIAVTIALLALTAIYMIGAIQLGHPISYGDPAASFYPWILIFIMITACICQLVSLKKQLKSGQEHDTGKKVFNMPFWLGTSAFTVFIFAFTFLGYWTASLILAFSIASIFEAKNENKKKKWRSIIILTFLIPIIGYLFYGTIFNIRFPQGILF